MWAWLKSLWYRIHPKCVTEKPPEVAVLPVLRGKDGILNAILDEIERQYDPKLGARYKTATAETDAELKKYPRLMCYRHEILKTCQMCRQKAGLPI